MKRRDVVTLAVGAATWPFARLFAAEEAGEDGT
jgi:hypothetical protein